MEQAAIRTEGLGKSFGSVRALDGIDLEVSPGTSSGCLAPTAQARRPRSGCSPP